MLTKDIKKKIFDCFLKKVLSITLGLLFPQQLFDHDPRK